MAFNETKRRGCELKPAFEQIPEELKALPQWVMWGHETRTGKLTKVPYSAKDDGNASVSDPTTWATFAEAKTAFENDGYDGVGFVFTKNDPFIGVDLDKCIDPQNGEIASWAQRIIADLDSYTELSPSGTGVHIIVKGMLPGSGRKNPVPGGGAIEMYDQGRYFTITGTRVQDTSQTIADRDEKVGNLYSAHFGNGEDSPAEPESPQDLGGQLNETVLSFQAAAPLPPGTSDDEELLRKARGGKGGAAFSRLYDHGDLSAYEDDHSRADLALCSKLAFWTGKDSLRIDRLFRRSALYRAKWDEPRPGGTYGSHTISQASNKVDRDKDAKPTKNVPKQALRTWQEIINSTGDDVRYVVEGMIEEGGTTLLIARQKAGKSMLVGQMSIDVSFGEHFLGNLPTKKGAVLYLDFENRPQILKKRGQDLGRGRELNDVHFAAWDRISDRDLGLDGENLKKLKQHISELKPVLLVIDPLRLATGTDTNDAQKVVQLLERSSELLTVNPTMGILIVHHVKKNQGDPEKTIKLRDDPREWVDKVHGSQALLAHVDIIVGFEQDGDDLFTLATVPRSYSSLIYALAKAPGSQRFVIAGNESQLRTWSRTQKNHWAKLPPDFSRSEGDELVGHSTLDRIIKKALQVGMLEQDKVTKRYKKVEILQPQEAGTSGILIDNATLNHGMNVGTEWADAGPLLSPSSLGTSQMSTNS